MDLKTILQYTILTSLLFTLKKGDTNDIIVVLEYKNSIE